MKTLLVVDDDEACRAVIRESLMNRGFEIVVAEGARDGLRLSQAHAFDAVLTDLEMPGANGLDFCRLLRRQRGATARSVPIWIMTGSIAVTIEETRAAGASGLFQKPFRPAEMAADIAVHLGHREADAAVVADAGV